MVSWLFLQLHVALRMAVGDWGRGTQDCSDPALAILMQPLQPALGNNLPPDTQNSLVSIASAWL